MKVLEGQSVDLISPFPTSHLSRVYGWLHCYNSVIEPDGFPKSPEEYTKLMAAAIPQTFSYGVIDKNNTTKSKHENPLVGVYMFEPTNQWNAYLHFASNRKAWKGKLMDEAAQLAIDDVFTNNPTILRLSGFILESNRPVRYMAQRMGWVKEALLEDWITQKGEPRNVIHYGLTRKQWLKRKETHGSNS